MHLQFNWVFKAAIMKKLKITSRPFIISALAAIIIFQTSCRKELLDQEPTTDLAAAQFWTTEADATTALLGAYASARPLFDRDYYFDGHGEYTRVRSGTLSTVSGNLRLGDAYNNANYNPSGYGAAFDKYYRYLYGGVNRANYVIENVNRMLTQANPTSVPALEAIVAGEDYYTVQDRYVELGGYQLEPKAKQILSGLSFNHGRFYLAGLEPKDDYTIRSGIRRK